MPARGSAIGLGGYGSSGGPSGSYATTPRPGSVYGGKVGGGAQLHHFLWLLVALEIAGLIALRWLFRHHHGG